MSGPLQSMNSQQFSNFGNIGTPCADYSRRLFVFPGFFPGQKEGVEK